MTPEQFCYWLQGYAEINGLTPSETEWEIVKDHLKTVFTKITPNYTPLPFTSPLFPNGLPEITC